MSWLSRFWKSMRSKGLFVKGERDLDDTMDFHDSTSLTLVSGLTRLRYGVVSTVGNVRELNEDNFHAPGLSRVMNGGSESGSGEMTASQAVLKLFIVADGMGGQQAGEEASRMAVELVPKALSRRLQQQEADSKQIQAAIREAVAEANHEILGSSGTVSEYSNMGTTVVLLLFQRDRAFVAGIGDSRAYRLRGDKLDQLTRDHSLARALVEAGTISEAELPNHRYNNILYLYLGSKDASSGPEDVPVLDVAVGDRFLLASDGLTGVVSDEAIKRILKSENSPSEAANALTRLALTNDSRDNVTSLVVHVVAPEVEVPATENAATLPGSLDSVPETQSGTATWSTGADSQAATIVSAPDSEQA